MRKLILALIEQICQVRYGRSAQRLRHLGAAAAVALALGGAQTAHASAVVPIDTMPGPGDATGSVQTFAYGAWNDVAVGFTVPTAGTITSITTALTANRWALGAFYVGIASNELIGNPANPSYFNPPPGSLVDYVVCSTQANVDGPFQSGCDYAEQAGDTPDFRLGESENLVMTPNLFLPSAGTYWVYTRFWLDTVFADWTTNKSIQTELIATRHGVCSSGGSAGCEADRTFFLVNGARDALGLQVAFEPGLRIPEPATFGLMGLGITGLLLSRRRRG